MGRLPDLAAHPSGVEQRSSSRASRSAPWSRKILGVLDVVVRANRWSGVTPSQSGRLGFIPRANRNSVSSRAFTGSRGPSTSDADGDASGEIGPVVQHQPDERFLALLHRVLERDRVVGERRIGGKDRGRGLHVTVIGEDFHRAGRSIRAEQLDHLRIGVPDGDRERVGGALDGRTREGSVLEQEPGDLVMAVVDGRIEGVAMRCDALLGQVRIGPALEEQLDDLEMTPGGGVLQRGAGTDVVRHVFRDAVRQRGISVQQLSDTSQVADARGRADIYVGAA